MGRIARRNAGMGLIVWVAALLGPVVVFHHLPDTTVVLGGGLLFVVTFVTGTLRDRRRARTVPERARTGVSR